MTHHINSYKIFVWLSKIVQQAFQLARCSAETYHSSLFQELLSLQISVAHQALYILAVSEDFQILVCLNILMSYLEILVISGTKDHSSTFYHV